MSIVIEGEKKCRHCGGSGKCSCKECRIAAEQRYDLGGNYISDSSTVTCCVCDGSGHVD